MLPTHRKLNSRPVVLEFIPLPLPLSCSTEIQLWGRNDKGRKLKLFPTENDSHQFVNCMLYYVSVFIFRFSLNISYSIVDNDVIQASNINRQVPALQSTIGRTKTSIMEERLKSINPELIVHIRELYINEETMEELLSVSYDHVVDAIDTLAPKIFFIERVRKLGMNLASSMGSGGKLDPAQIKIDDFSKSYNCKLAYLLRKKLRLLGITTGFRVVFSTEMVDKSLILPAENEKNKKSTLGTISYIPSIFGSMLASIVVEDITS